MNILTPVIGSEKEIKTDIDIVWNYDIHLPHIIAQMTVKVNSTASKFLPEMMTTGIKIYDILLLFTTLKCDRSCETKKSIKIMFHVFPLPTTKVFLFICWWLRIEGNFLPRTLFFRSKFKHKITRWNAFYKVDDFTRRCFHAVRLFQNKSSLAWNTRMREDSTWLLPNAK